MQTTNKRKRGSDNRQLLPGSITPPWRPPSSPDVRAAALVRGLYVRLHVDGDDGVDGGECGGRRAAPARGGSVASGPRNERMQPGAGYGDHLAARGGLARGIGLARSGGIQEAVDAQ